MLSGEVKQRDFRAIGLGDCSSRKKCPDGIVEGDFFLLDHLGEDKSGEGFCYGADFKHGIGLSSAVGKDFGLAMIIDADCNSAAGGFCEIAVIECGGEFLIQRGL